MTEDRLLTVFLFVVMVCIIALMLAVDNRKINKAIDENQRQIDSLNHVIELKNDSLKVASEIIDENMKNSRISAND